VSGTRTTAPASLPAALPTTLGRATGARPRATRAMAAPGGTDRLRRLGLLLATALVAAACSTLAATPERVLTIDGPEDGGLYNADGVADLSLRVAAALEMADGGDADASQPDLSDLRVLLDGDDVTDEAEVDRDELTWVPGDLEDGERTVILASDPSTEEEPDADLEVLETWTFTVDATPPELEVALPDGGLVAGQPVTIEGVTEAGAVVSVGDEEVTAGDDGSWAVELASPPEGELAIVATDAAGNSTSDEVGGFVVVPSRATVDELRTVHVSFCGWATPSLREPVLQMIDDGLINAVQIDLKDETGKIGFPTENELAAQVGSDQPDCLIDIEAAVAQLHERDVPVVGRVVAFADPVLAPWAWENGDRDMVIQTADGDIYTGRYAGFTNFANPDVIEYNISIAEEAAAMGVDHILWDYIRKPDGPVSGFTFAGLEGTPEEALVEFTRLADERLAPYGVEHGASLYGVSGDRPWEVSQDVEGMADHLDYVAPMIYPSHWGPGEYGVANPLMQPYDMVAATLEVWLEATEGKRARVAPWLEDSNWPIRLGYPDRASYVEEQIRATYDAGINEWLLWDSAVRYTTGGMRQP
jgi:hypothetical protein